MWAFQTGWKTKKKKKKKTEKKKKHREELRRENRLSWGAPLAKFMYRLVFTRMPGESQLL